MNDEFGEDSFLDGFDLDAVLGTGRSSDTAAAPASPPSAKRRRISLSPGSMDSDSLKGTLKQYYGYNDFRPGQLSVIQSILVKRDAAVFWSTGSGKSLCYQLPALHMGQVALVISPLISLMQDQVHKLNSVVDEPLAAFLGSAQTDPTVESKALTGKFALLYVTPEKVQIGSFLDRLAQMHKTHRQIGVIAVDEAHCVSEWGHDFRPDYRSLHVLRERFPDIPLLSLTATATPRVQQDIVQSLGMNKNVLISSNSIDRKNLNLRILKKGGGIEVCFKDLLQEWNQETTLCSSTIVYCPSKATVDQVAAFLQGNTKSVAVAAYHAGKSTAERAVAHNDFLTGKVQVLVATVAFGMGIDKPDIRRVVHYGPPKTVEEYYQQIGRAGRDGLPAECIMFVSESDFDRYKSDFYLGNLSAQAKEAVMDSTNALRRLAFDAGTCRRKSLLDFFGEVPPFGNRCGTCDVCRNVEMYGDDLERDFGNEGARAVLTAVLGTNEESLTTLMKMLVGNAGESNRYSQLQRKIEELQKKQKRKKSQTYYRDLFTPLVQRGYLSEKTKTADINGFQRHWTVYRLTQKGRIALDDPTVPVLLPVPESIRKLEKKEEERRQRILAELEASGVPQEKLPQQEIETGDGEVIRAYSAWLRYLSGLRRTGESSRITQVEALLSRIDHWRSDVAVKYLIAPGSVLSEHTMVSIAYTVATLPRGVKVDKETLEDAGVRSREVDSLVATVGAWVDESQPKSESVEQSDETMVLGTIQGKTWKYAVYKPAKKTGKPVWELSHDRFEKGESPASIAMSQLDGKKPIQAGTVVGHLLDAITHGRVVDLERVAEFATPPTKSEWDQLVQAEAAIGMDVAGDPETAGKNGGKLSTTDLMRPIIGDAVCDTPFAERSPADKRKLGQWFELAKWYISLRRAGIQPRFGAK